MKLEKQFAEAEEMAERYTTKLNDELARKRAIKSAQAALKGKQIRANAQIIKLINKSS